MIFNNYRALEAVLRLKDGPLTEQAVLNLHSRRLSRETT